MATNIETGSSLLHKNQEHKFACHMRSIIAIFGIMLTKVAVIACFFMFLTETGLSQEPLIPQGTHVLTPALSAARSFGSNDGWVPGFNLSYGYLVNDWIQPEGGIQFERGFTDNPFYAGSALGGVSFFYNRGSWVLPFGGFRFGLGVMRENDSSGGVQNRMTVTLAPKVGVLFRVSKLIGIYMHIEYQRVFVIGDERQGYKDLNLLRIPVGVSFMF
jgi:hypothetical protein